MMTLAVFAAYIQALPLGSVNDPGFTGLRQWHAISADPYQTRFFALQILALAVYSRAVVPLPANDERRMRILIHVVIAVAVASAVFSMLRQTSRQEAGFRTALC